MTPLLFGLPLAAALAIILLSIGMRPTRVVLVWALLSVITAFGALTMGGSADAPEGTKATHSTPAERPGTPS